MKNLWGKSTGSKLRNDLIVSVEVYDTCCSIKKVFLVD